MKNIKILTAIIVLMVAFTAAAYAQKTEKTKSASKSALIDAKQEVSADILDTIFDVNMKFDHDKAFAKAMSQKINECFVEDIENWASDVKANAAENKWKKIPISFETDKDAAKIPAKAIRNYKKAFNRLKHNFFKLRKTKTLDEVKADKLLKRYNKRVVAAFSAQKKREYNRASR